MALLWTQSTLTIRKRKAEAKQVSFRRQTQLKFKLLSLTDPARRSSTAMCATGLLSSRRQLASTSPPSVILVLAHTRLISSRSTRKTTRQTNCSHRWACLTTTSEVVVSVMEDSTRRIGPGRMKSNFFTWTHIALDRTQSALPRIPFLAMAFSTRFRHSSRSRSFIKIADQTIGPCKVSTLAWFRTITIL